jgi:endonuclease-3 related protein
MGKKAVTGTLLDVYHRLLDRYGPQHWWPADSPFEVMIGAILTQSAAWGNVEKAVNNLKARDVLSIDALRRLPAEELARLVYPSGYYNAKAGKIKALVQWLAERYEGNLDKLFVLDIPLLRRELLSIRGVGEETADSIILYAAGKPVFVIDAYTRRILHRLDLAPSTDSYAAFQDLFMQHLPHDEALFNEYHALLVRHGKTTCRKAQHCQECCMASFCPAPQKSTTVS